MGLRRLAVLTAATAAAAAVAAVPSSGTFGLRLAEATKPDWRGAAGLVFAADSATVAIEADGPAAPSARVRRSPDAPWGNAPLAPDGPHRWLLSLPEPGWYDIRVSPNEFIAAEGGDLTFTVAILGSPIPEEWRTNSVFGIWNVHGDPALIRLAGARWNRRMTSFRDVTPDDAANYGDIEMQNAENSSLVTRHSSLTEGVASPYIERDGLAQVGVFSFGMPLWTMDMPEDVKLPSFGNPFYPAKDWADVSRAVAAYARTHALPRDMSIYNEPLAHFQGKPAQIADYARAVRAGLKAADPSFRIGGPGLYSIRIRDLTAIEEGGLLESLDFLDMHAYVGGTPPEGEFVRKIEMLRDWLAAHGRADMPVYLTEFGWTAAEGTWQPPVERATQARYVARSLAFAWSQGVDALVYFALDYRTKKAGEAAFSLIGPDGRPEAGYCAFAAVSRHFAASKPIGHILLAPGVHMVAGHRAGRLQLMVWSEETGAIPDASVHLPFPIERATGHLGEPLDKSVARPEVGPYHDRELLNPSVLSRSAQARADFPARPAPCFLETAPLANLDLPLLSAKQVIQLPELDGDSAFWAVPGVGDPPDGLYAAFVRQPDGNWAVQSYELRSPATIASAEVRWPADSARPVVEVVVQSNETERDLAVQLGLGDAESTSLMLAPGEKRTVSLPLAVASGEPSRSTLRLMLPGGAVRERVLDATALPVWPSTAASAPFLSSVPWLPFGASEPAPSTPSLRLGHSPDAFLVELVVHDDEHAPSDPADPSRLWAQDSIQLAFDMDPLKPWEAGFAGAGNSQTLGGHRVFELSIADAGDGHCIAYLERSWNDALPAGTVRPAIRSRVERDDAAATTRYRVRIPWAELGAAESPPRPGDAIGFSLAINDANPARGAPRHGLRLFGGIVDDKEPQHFGRVWLRPALETR